MSPLPVRLQIPLLGFSLAVSGMMIPAAVFSSAAAGSIKTLSPIGLLLLPLYIVFQMLIFNHFGLVIFYANAKCNMLLSHNVNKNFFA